MGRKRKKQQNFDYRQPTTLAAISSANGGQDGTGEVALCDVSTKKKISRRGYNQFEPANSIDNCCAQSSMQSSWFSEVRWISRHDHELHEKSHDAETNSSVQKNISTQGANLTNNETELSAVSSSKLIVSKPPPTDTHLLSELNQLKQQLMPAARACADVINKYECRNATTPGYEFRQARSMCNPYECLGSKKSKNRKYSHQHSSSGLSQFINRSAIKLSNIDALLGFCLTSTVHQQKQMANNEDEPFIFVDLCGAPGGFSEYILHRHVHPASIPDNHPDGSTSHRENQKNTTDDVQPCFGFGMSLSGSNGDGNGVRWDLDHLKRFHPDKKVLYHVCNGADGTGSIYNWENVLRLQCEMSTTVSGRGGISSMHKPLADLVVADGGFDAQRDSNNQEAVAHRIIVSQTAAALSLLCSGNGRDPGGIFVLKMFGFREDATRRMLHYLYGRFDKITFVKPILSRPASAERYLVCHGYLGPGPDWNGGLLWREQMLCEEKTCAQKHAPLEDLMDSFDSEMLQLNIDTCRSIISYLDDKKDTQEGGGDIPVYPKQIDQKYYEGAWQLF
ncbi:hypothetical protein ACHAXR_011987 [Thalassiosira sp. AJA248-18]